MPDSFHSARSCDIAIIGGGPAGATLGARLARESDLDIVILEGESFPREHIGESLTHIVVPLLDECGALEPVLNSDCYIRKAGGYYFWDGTIPWVTFFEHARWQADGHRRWSFHVNRAEFDSILLDNARRAGCDVLENALVSEISPHNDGDFVGITLRDGRTLDARLVADASGRPRQRGSVTTPKSFLPGYRNVAIWTHIVDGRPAQALEGDWNIFREPDLSPIGNFAADEGWFWYIPVPLEIDGVRRQGHSLGLVTHPDVIREGRRYEKAEDIIDAARSVPYLGDLVATAQPAYDKVNAATNYSMISPRIVDYDGRYIALGDAAFFVDPLFSTGVSFALLHAAAAARVILARFDPDFPEKLARDAWTDYAERLSETARAFALGIDQWYGAIAGSNPNSVYWKGRSGAETVPFRRQCFQALINVALSGDFLRIVTRGTNDFAAMDHDGPLLRTVRDLVDLDLSPAARVRLRHGVTLSPSVSLEPLDRSSDLGRPTALDHGPYWDNPVGHRDSVRRFYSRLWPCARFRDGSGNSADRPSVRCSASDAGVDMLYAKLSAGWLAVDDLQRDLAPSQEQLLHHLLIAGLLEQETA